MKSVVCVVLTNDDMFVRCAHQRFH